MMLAQRPELIAAERPHRDNVSDTDPRSFYAPYRHEVHDFWKGIDGYSDSPDQASEEKGRRYWEAVVGAVARTFIEFAKVK